MTTERWFVQDITQPIVVQHCEGVVFTADNNGNSIGVRLYDGGIPISPGGTATCNVIRPDGVTVSFDGTVSGNAISAILPVTALAVPGVIGVVLQSISGSVVTTVFKGQFTCEMTTTETVVAPSVPTSSLAQLTQDVISLQNGKVNKSGDTMTGWLRWFASSPVTGLEWASADGTLFQLRPYTSGNIMQFVVVPQGTGIATGAITIQNDGTIGFSKPVPITSGGTGEATQAGAMGVMGLLCDSGNKTTFAFDNLSLLTNTGKFKYGILFGGEIDAPFIYHVFVSVDNSVTFTQVLGGSNVATFTGTVSGSTLTLTGDRTVYGGVRLLWLNY